MYNKPLLLVIFCIALCSLGCHNAKEAEEVAFITAIGLDKADQNQLKVTYQISIPRSVGNQQGSGQELNSGPAITTTITSSSVAEAFNILSSTIPRFPNRTHLKVIVISEELARSGLEDLITPMVRFREYRGSMFLCICQGKAQEFLTANKPHLDYLPPKFWEDFMLLSDETNYYTHADIHEFYLRLKNPGASPYATYVAINKMTEEDTPTDGNLPNQKIKAYLAGDIPRSGKVDTLDFMGTAVFRNGSMVGILDSRETRVLSLLQNNLNRGFIIPDDPLETKKQIMLNVRNGKKTDVEAKLVDGQAHLAVNVFVEAEIAAIPSGINYEKTEYREQLETTLSQLLKAEIERFILHTQDLGSDVVGFGYYLRPYFTNYAELENTNLEQLYKNAQVEVTVTSHIRRTGLMWRSSPYKPVENPL